MAVENEFLTHFVEETTFYNRIILSHLLPASLWEPLPHFLQTWLRNYLAGNLLYFISGFLWCFYIYYLKLNVYFPKGNFAFNFLFFLFSFMLSNFVVLEDFWAKKTKKIYYIPQIISPWKWKKKFPTRLHFYVVKIS